MLTPSRLRFGNLPARVRLTLLFLAAVALMGCRETETANEDVVPRTLEQVSVRGAVTYEEGAVTQGEITFTPIDGGEPMTATVTDGHYELQAEPGKYRITLTGSVGDAELPPDLAVERTVDINTNGAVVNVAFPNAPSDSATPEEVRESDAERTDGE